MGYEHGDSFPFDVEPNGILFGSKSKGKLSPQPYPIQCERKWKYSFLSVLNVCLNEICVQVRAQPGQISFSDNRIVEYCNSIVCFEGNEGGYHAIVEYCHSIVCFEGNEGGYHAIVEYCHSTVFLEGNEGEYCHSIVYFYGNEGEYCYSIVYLAGN